MAGDSRHTLTAEETSWCVAVRDALKAAGIALPPEGGDFLLAQFAIVAKGDTDKALSRVKNYLKYVVGEFKYSTAAASASEVNGFMERKFPGIMVLLPDHDSHPHLSCNVKAYNPSSLQGEEFDMLFHDCLLYTSPSPRDS